MKLPPSNGWRIGYGYYFFVCQYLCVKILDLEYFMTGRLLPIMACHQSRLFRMEIFGADGRAWHRVYNENYMPRTSSATGFFAFPFDGTTFMGNNTRTLPDGEYYTVISVLIANGVPGLDWETWTSPNFVIDRP